MLCPYVYNNFLSTGRFPVREQFFKLARQGPRVHIKKKRWDSRKGTALLRGDSCVQDSGGTHKK